MKTKEEIIEQLRNNVCKVGFTKVNGEYREMTCTLKADIVPAYERKTPVITEASEKEKATVSVWDVDKKAWRSFRVESVKTINISA